MSIDSKKVSTAVQVLLAMLAAVYTAAPDMIPGTIDDATIGAAITLVDVLLQKKKTQ